MDIEILTGIYQIKPLTWTTIWANSADDKLVIFFLIFPRKQDSTFQEIVSSRAICIKRQILFSGKMWENISTCRLLKILIDSAKRLSANHNYSRQHFEIFFFSKQRSLDFSYEYELSYDDSYELSRIIFSDKNIVRRLLQILVGALRNNI